MKLFAFAALLVTSTAWASTAPQANQHQGQKQGQGQLQGQLQGQSSVNRNSSSSKSSSAAAALGIGIGLSTSGVSNAVSTGDSVSEATGGDANATGGEGGSADNNQDIDIDASSNYSSRGTSRVRITNTPTVFAPNITATVNCFKGRSGGASGPGFGLSFGGGKIDEGCVMRENIRMAHEMGLANRAIFLWCNQVEVTEMFDSLERCLTFNPRVEEIPAGK